MIPEHGTLISLSPDATFAHARDLAPRFPHALVLLQGSLGTGKTMWAKGFATGLGLQRPVYSPTFTIMNHYFDDGRSLYHLDLYRISCLEELHDLGLFEILDAGMPCLVEWPERVPALASLPHLRVSLDFASRESPATTDSRTITWKWLPAGA